MDLITNFFKKLTENLADKVSNKEFWKKNQRTLSIVIPLLLLLIVYAYGPDKKQWKFYYMRVANPQAYEDITTFRKLYPEFKELGFLWENLSTEDPSSVDARTLNKKLQNYVSTFTRFDYDALKPYPEYYVFFVINAATAYTMAAIQYESLTSLKEANRMFAYLESALSDKNFDIDEEWLIDNQILTKMTGMQVHLKAYEAVLSEQGENRNNLLKDIDGLSKQHGGISEQIRSGKLLNAKTIRYLTQLGLYPPK